MAPTMRRPAFWLAVALTAITLAALGFARVGADEVLPVRARVQLIARDQPLPTNSPTASPTASPTVTPPPGDGSRAAPVPAGTLALLAGNWYLKVLSVIPNATALVLAENQFNDPPKPGNQFFIARIEASYTGTGMSRFDGSFRLRAIGTSSVLRSTFEDSCGVIPSRLPDPDVFTGATITGNLCWEIPSTDAASMLVVDRPFLADDGITFVSMLPPGVAPPAVPGPPSLAPFPVTGTMGNPVPVGQAVPFTGAWNVTVVSVTPNATAAVLAENQFNDPPAAGKQFFIARVRATFAGTGSDRFDGSFRLRTVGGAGIVWTTFGNSCGVIPDRLVDAEVFPSGTIEGNLCWEVPSSDASSLAMFDDPFLAEGNGIFLSLH